MTVLLQHRHKTEIFGKLLAEIWVARGFTTGILDFNDNGQNVRFDPW
ncbi:hypothetical protein [Pseudidiomarina homiensis]|nr:hypothetical protein [Pseudidiomarina homiensis]